MKTAQLSLRSVTLDVTAHHLLNLGVVALSLFLVWRLRRMPAMPVWAPAGAATVQSGMLFVISMVSALAYPTNNFGRGQLMAWTIFLFTPLLLLGLAVILHPSSRITAYGCSTLAAIISLVALDAFLIEPRWLKVSHVTIQTTKLTTPVRVAILADIQTDAPGAYEARAIEKAMDASPDLILFTGDYIQMGKRSRSYEHEAAALNAILKEAKLDAPLGAFAVMGNVDRHGEWTQVFAGLPVAVVETRTQFDLGEVHVTGLSLTESFDVAASVPGTEAFHIAIGHSPNFSLGDVRADLLVAGHTHGGQVQLPIIGPIMTLSAVSREWASGATQIAPGKMLIVSNGIGMERGHAPRLRFLCRPEMIIVDIVPE